MLFVVTAPVLALQEQAPQDHQHDAAAETLFPSRDSSGTAWLPDRTPMYGLHRQRGVWEVMLHGNTFLQYLYESGEEHRRAQQVGSINWFMGMARRPFAGGRGGVRGMVSLEPFTIGGCGYPVLLATGETCDGDTIHDRQHPHDLFMEFAVEYDRPLAPGLRWSLYAGPAGEPALGPPAFPHRLSAMANLLAPIGHHWLDATHITYGVLTTGVYSNRWKGEASLFNGREPDERRTDLDLAPLDSFSGRVWFLPTDRLALQVSAGRLAEAEAAHDNGGARVDVTRTTVSATYHGALGAAGFLATTLGWGMNRELADTTHAFTLELVGTRDSLNTWFGRAELTGKVGDDLHVHEAPQEVFTVGRIQAGYVRYMNARRGLQPGVGGSVSFSLVPEPLAPRYGGRVAPGFGLFLTVRPAAHAPVGAADPHAGHVMPAPASPDGR
jgi:hypothetical protein